MLQSPSCPPPSSSVHIGPCSAPRPVGGHGRARHRARTAGSVLIEDRLRLRGADPRDAQRHHRQQVVEGPHAAGRLDLHALGDGAAHERQVGVRRAAGSEPGRRLHEVGAGGLGETAGAHLLLIGEVRVLEDDLDDRARGVGDLDDRTDVVAHPLVPPGFQRPDVDDHVELPGAGGD
jgi:hypothetical protein